MELPSFSVRARSNTKFSTKFRGYRGSSFIWLRVISGGLKLDIPLKSTMHYRPMIQILTRLVKPVHSVIDFRSSNLEAGEMIDDPRQDLVVRKVSRVVESEVTKVV